MYDPEKDLGGSYENERSFRPDDIKVTDKNTVLLMLEKKHLDLESLRGLAQEYGLEEKSEFHITVLGFKPVDYIKELLEPLEEEDKEKTWNEIQKLVTAIDWKISIEPKRYYVQKEYQYSDPDNPENTLQEKRESFIQMVTVHGLQEFYDKLNALLGTSFEYPPPHVTLYAGSDREETANIGIGIYSYDDFEHLKTQEI